MRPGQIIGPAILIAIGVLFLANNLGWEWPIGEVISTFWPLILVGLGVAHIARALIAGRGGLAGGIILLTLGVLFSLHQIWGIRFGETWPVLLIAIGAIGLLRGMLGPAIFGRSCMKGGVRR